MVRDITQLKYDMHEVRAVLRAISDRLIAESNEHAGDENTIITEIIAIENKEMRVILSEVISKLNTQVRMSRTLTTVDMINIVDIMVTMTRHIEDALSHTSKPSISTLFFKKLSELENKYFFTIAAMSVAGPILLYIVSHMEVLKIIADYTIKIITVFKG